MYSAGDLIIFEIATKTFYGEIVGVDSSGKVEVSRLKKTKKQENRIWEFVADDEWSAIDSTFITKHVPIPDSAQRSETKKAWKEIGFLAGGDGMTFCRIEDEDATTLPLYGGDESDEEDEGIPSTKLGMHGYEDDGFVIPDDEGSDFEFADPDELDEEGAKFVRETHKAVREFDNWVPEDNQGHAIKAFIDTMDKKASIETDNQRLAAGKVSISTSKPPIKKRKR